MAKRSNGEGTIGQRSDGRWEAKLSYTDSETGQRKRISVYGKTKGAARAKLKEVRDRLDDGRPPRDSTATVAEWLAHWRATTLAASSRAEATKAQYSMLSAKHLEPAPFGAMTLDKLRRSDIEGLILAMRSKTRTEKCGTKVRALSGSTIRSTFGVLRQALDAAVDDDLLARNPASLVKRPGIERLEARYLTADHLIKVLGAAKDMRYHAALVLIANTGLRRGEALALRWADIDLKAGSAKVRSTLGRVGKTLVISSPKTERSRRTVPLSSAMVTMLEAHKKIQAAERLKAANLWEDNGLVFCTELGRPVDPRNVLREVQLAAAKVGLSGVGVHTLRHSVATALMEGGTHMKAIADLLGHSSTSITGDVYSHTSDHTARAAVEGLSQTFGLPD